MNRKVASVAGFGLLFFFLVYLFLPTFSNPPHVDYWEAFFTFHQVRADPDLAVWPHIVNHDPWRHGTFRPLSYTTLYLQHVVFGRRFVFNHIANFFFYCLLLVLLFRLGRRLGARGPELGAFLAVYAVLYSHCDVLSLNFHIFLVAGFAAAVGAFLLYIRYLEGAPPALLIVVGLLFLSALLAYETFVFWPPAVLILLYAKRHPGAPRRVLSFTGYLLGLLYGIYAAIFFFTRSASHISGDLPSVPLTALTEGLLYSLFNVLYTGFGVNVFPTLAYPGRYEGYSEMLGVMPISPAPWLVPLAYAAATVALILAGVLTFLLLRQGKRRTLAVAAFLGYLYLGNFSMLVAARSTTTDISHILRQFRYQLIPNAILILLSALIFSALFQASRRSRVILVTTLTVLFLGNSFFTRRHIDTVTTNLSPLKELLNNIRTGIDRGDITPDRRLYLPDGFAGSFPRLCWSRSMGRKMYGTYQWIFSPVELRCFSLRPEGSYWTMDMDKGVYVRR